MSKTLEFWIFVAKIVVHTGRDVNLASILGAIAAEAACLLSISVFYAKIQAILAFFIPIKKLSGIRSWGPPGRGICAYLREVSVSVARSATMGNAKASNCESELLVTALALFFIHTY